MKIGIINASSQKSKNRILEKCVKEAAGEQHEVINFGIYENDQKDFSYIQAAICVGLLLESKSVDFVVTGCSSGQGMMLACNTLPGVLCGYVENVSDAYLFGRINNGNAVSYPLGLNWGWGAEINLTDTLKALFSTPMGIGYPREEAGRKMRDTAILKEMNRLGKVDFTEFLKKLMEREEKLVRDAVMYPPVYGYVMEHGVGRITEETQTMNGREDKKSNDLFFTCSLIAYMARKTKNKPSDIVNILGRKTLEKIYDLADVYHSDNIDRVSDDFIGEKEIKTGTFDNVLECGYSVPTHWDIGKVYKRLILMVSKAENMEIIDTLMEVYNSEVSVLIEDYNGSFYYENPQTIFETYQSGVIE